MKEKVAIVYGGKSVEHDISIITAMQISKFLPKDFDYVFVYIDKEGRWWGADNLIDIKIYKNFQKLAKNKKRVSLLLGDNVLLTKKGRKFVESEKIFSVLNCCHGRIGEDGCLAGILKASQTAQTSCDVVSSAICMDKAFMKDILKANKISSTQYICLKKNTYENMKACECVEQKIGYPVIVKPANLGSSIGISVCKNAYQFSEGVDFALNFDDKVLVEKYIENLDEFNCACFEYENELFVSDVSKVFLEKDIFTFDDKYLKNNQKNESVCGFLMKKIKETTKKVYKLFDCAGVVRVDFLFDKTTKKLYVNEINTIPGALAFYLFKDISLSDFVRSLIFQSRKSFEKKEKLVTSYESDALDIFDKLKFSCKK